MRDQVINRLIVLEGDPRALDRYSALVGDKRRIDFSAILPAPSILEEQYDPQADALCDLLLRDPSHQRLSEVLPPSPVREVFEGLASEACNEADYTAASEIDRVVGWFSGTPTMERAVRYRAGRLVIGVKHVREWRARCWGGPYAPEPCDHLSPDDRQTCFRTVGGIYDRIFSVLARNLPEHRLLIASWRVRWRDGTLFNLQNGNVRARSIAAEDPQFETAVFDPDASTLIGFARQFMSETGLRSVRRQDDDGLTPKAQRIFVDRSP